MIIDGDVVTTLQRQDKISLTYLSPNAMSLHNKNTNNIAWIKKWYSVDSFRLHNRTTMGQAFLRDSLKQYYMFATLQLT